MVAKASAKLALKAKAQRVRLGTVQHPHAAMARQARPVLKAKGRVAVKVVVVKSNAAIHVSTTAVMAKAVLHHAAHVPKAVAQVVVRKAAMGGKTATAATVTSCHAISTP